MEERYGLKKDSKGREKEERIEKGERRLIVCRYIKANKLAGNKKLEFFMRQSC
jgi:hypothetical protein